MVPRCCRRGEAWLASGHRRILSPLLNKVVLTTPNGRRHQLAAVCRVNVDIVEAGQHAMSTKTVLPVTVVWMSFWAPGVPVSVRL